MSNLFNDTTQDHNRKPDQSGVQNDHADHVTPSTDTTQSFTHSVTDDTDTNKNATIEPVQGAEVGISQFLKTEVGSPDPESNTLNTASVVQSVGHLLRNERLTRKMSVEDISRQLRISAQQVEAIENEDFDKLPGRTFVRGFVRNYAMLLQLDANAILKMLPGGESVIKRVEHTPFKIQEMTPSSRESKGGGNILQIIVILAALAGGGYFLYEKMPFWNLGEEAGDKNIVVQQGSDSDTVEMQLVLPKPSLNLSTSPGGGTQLSPNTNPSASVVTQNPINSLNTIGTLVFDFTADTRVKVTDGNDDIIFEQNNIRGTQQRVNGKRPLSVLIDKASAVELNYNDRVIDIKPYTHPTKGSANLMLE